MSTLLDEYRNEIDDIDEQLLTLLEQRFAVTKKVGVYKKEHAMPLVDEAREASQFAKMRKQAEAHNLNPDFAANMLRVIIDEVVRNHARIAAQS